MIDLHCHSTASDGSFTPTELIGLANKNGVKALALTDHDCIDGVAEATAVAESCGMRMIAGTELSCEFGINELHIVGLFINTASPVLQDFFAQLKQYRLERNIQLIKSLQNKGIIITEEELTVNGKELSSVGRPNFARIIAKKGYVKNVFEAFDKYLSNMAAEDVKRKKVSDKQAIDMIHQAGGLAILAHPDQTGAKTHEQLVDLIADLKTKGLDGMEVYYNGYKRHLIKEYRKIAHKFDLLISGGSDFHSNDKGTRAKLGYFGENKAIPDEILDIMDRFRA